METGEKNVVLMPTYNERENIGFIIPEIFSILPNTKILVIDDNSPDKTAEVVKGLMRNYSQLNILERDSKDGIGEAYKAGIKYVLNNYDDIRSVVAMDADGSHDPEYLKAMIEEINNYDLVIGSRYNHGGGVEDWELWREMLSRFGNIYSKLLLGVKINDLTAGFKCIRTDLLRKINFDNIGSSGYAYQIEFKYNCAKIPGTRIKEIPIVFKTRREGESKISNHIIMEGLKTPFKMFLKRIWKKK